MKNDTEFSDFFLYGFSAVQNLSILIFAFLLMIQIMTLMGNLLIIGIVLSTHHIHSPMYFFLVQLSISDLLQAINTGPTMLHVTLTNGGTISFGGCICQLYFSAVVTVFECFFLSSMSYDRYLAICNPLRYQSLMNIRIQVHLTLWPWFLGFVFPLPIAISIGSFEFCGQHIIDHFVCNLVPLLKLSCSDTSVLELQMLIMSLPVLPIPLLLIFLTYGCISVAILKISSSTGRQKAFSTCSSHLIVVCMFYGTLSMLYLVPSGEYLRNINKTLSFLYTVVTPLCNPLIYSLRNHDIMDSLVKLFSKISSLRVNEMC